MNIALTMDDMNDLRDHHTINACAVDGSEVVISGNDISDTDFTKLLKGGTLTDTFDGIEVTLSYEHPIPPDFIEIDGDTDHWKMTYYDGKVWCVPATEAGNDRLSDMTDAMMSEIPGLDDPVVPRKLRDTRFWKFAHAFLMQDGNLGVPGGRYGRDTRDCADAAILMSYVMQYHNGEPITYYQLNSDMGMVVNSADGVAETLSESQYIFDEESGIDIKELLGDAYEPQAKLERLVKWAEGRGLLMGTDENSEGTGIYATILFDEDDADNLIDAILANEAPFDLNE
jgi:hypothetical protein